jgi:hypothetical protein
VNDQPEKSLPSEPQSDPSDSSLRSPIRPTRPEDTDTQRAAATAQSGLLARGAQLAAPKSAVGAESDDSAQNPQMALDILRRKMEVVATEFGQGNINRAQFNAIYGRYSEQRTIIEKLIARDPNNQAWKQAAAPGHTTFLRDHFESRLLYYLVYQHDVTVPLMMGGKQQPNMDQIGLVLKQLWGMKNRPKVGLARKSMNNGQWLVLALGEYAVTLALFQLEPSSAQANLVRDLHGDFERANRRVLERGTRSLDRFVFPQRALAEKQF